MTIVNSNYRILIITRFQHISFFNSPLLPIPYSQFPIPYSQFPIPILPIPNSPFPIPILPIPYSQFPIPLNAQAFHGELAVNGRNDDITVDGRERTVDNEEIAGVDAGVDHRVTFDTDEVSRSGTLHQQCVQIQRRLQILLRR